jgi:hypothetical protein
MMQEMKRNQRDVVNDREAEATSEETLTDLEEQQEIAEGTDNNEIVSPDSELNQPARQNDQELM